MEKTPFHPGELKIQALAGEAQIAGRNGRLIADKIPNGALKFVDKQPFVLAASLDQAQNIWVSLLAGQPGFLQAESPEAARLNTAHLVSAENDIFWTNVAGQVSVGLLFIELATRRRLKVNGPVTFAPDGTGLRLRVQECFPLCPRYIQRREVAVIAATRQAGAAPETGVHFTRALQSWINSADTLFVGSGHDDDHIDVGHRGGNPGFVRILDEHTLRIPDYNGNSMFNSLGNFSINPRAGLLFINYETGDTLQLTGRTELDFTGPDHDDTTAATGNFICKAGAGSQAWKASAGPFWIIRHLTCSMHIQASSGYSQSTRPLPNHRFRRQALLHQVSCACITPNTHPSAAYSAAANHLEAVSKSGWAAMMGMF